jgi:antitoxin CcdA
MLQGGISMKPAYDRKAPKQAANLSINKDLLNAARAAGVNLSATLEEALADKVAIARRENWVKDNSGAIAAYNDFVEENGLASDGTRSF